MSGQGQEQGVVEFLRASVAVSTSTKYDTSWWLWVRFRKSQDLFLQTLTLQSKVNVMVAFAMSLKNDVGISPGQIESVFSAISFQFRTNSIDTVWLKSDIISTAKKSCSKKWTERAVAERRLANIKLPWTLELNQVARKRLWSKGVDGRMTYLGIAIGFNNLNRISEVIQTSSEHGFMVEDCELFMVDGRILKPWEVRQMRRKVEIAHIMLTNVSSKSSHGKGRLLPLYVGMDERQKQLVEDLVAFFREAGSKEGDPLLSRWKLGRRKILTSKMVSTAMKETAESCGLNPAEFSTKCLRIGGNTALSAANVDRSIVKQIGGWSNKADNDQFYNRALHPGALSVVPQVQSVTIRPRAKTITA